VIRVLVILIALATAAHADDTTAAYDAAVAAERAGDRAAARAAYERVVALGGDERMVSRAKLALARIGASGTFDAVNTAYDGLAAKLVRGGDPNEELEAIEALVRGAPGWPRAEAAKLVLAKHWETEGETDRAIGWLRDAGDSPRVRTELARVLVRHDRDEAPAAIARVEERALRDYLEAELASATRGRWLRRVAWLVVVLGALGAAWMLRRSWRALARPPTEVLFAAPIAAVFSAVALTGNPLVGRAVVIVLGAGLAVSWVAGAIGRRAAAVVAVMVVAAVAYLAIGHGQLASMIAETWRAGHEH